MPESLQKIELPDLFQLNDKLAIGSVQQLLSPATPIEGTLTPYQECEEHCQAFTPSAEGLWGKSILIVRQKKIPKKWDGLVLQQIKPQTYEWLPNPQSTLQKNPKGCESVITSWHDKFHFRLEERNDSGVIKPGLRPPQIGAIHAVMSHWTVTSEPETVVMPTGTGKTETMLGLLIAERLKKLYVIVPTDALRGQVAKKFRSLGILVAASVIDVDVEYPIVGVLKRKPKSIEEVDGFFSRCNVIVTTANIAGQCTPEIRKHIANYCSHLFIDEAHHVPANTWNLVRKDFESKPILQFTATPYREDGKLLSGKVVYSYPLKKAQTEGYFKEIRFKGIREYRDELSDFKIAEMAVQQLREDIKAGWDHILLARCRSIKRAEAVIDEYQKIASEFSPILIHSQLAGKAKEQKLQQLKNGDSKIVVCVDMFGEGFDMPELKIAALHDVHKTLTVTLQFVGRFTRTNPKVGDATIIANIANAEVSESLETLYSEEPDWNVILRDLSEAASGDHQKQSELIRQFMDPPARIPLQNIAPKMSTSVYETQCKNWSPQSLGSLPNLYEQPSTNHESKVIVFVTKERETVDWGNIRELYNTEYHLHMVYWDKESSLLFIHSSDKQSLLDRVAKKVCGDNVKPIKGETVFRGLFGIKQLIFSNLGLGHTLNRNVRFTMFVGDDIGQGLAESQATNKRKTNIFGRGICDGKLVTMGCSTKGKFWAFHPAKNLQDWLEWCQRLGKKLLDKVTPLDRPFKTALIPRVIQERPIKTPIVVEWPLDVLVRDEEGVWLELAENEVPLSDVSLDLVDYSENGPIRFRVRTDKWLLSADAEQLSQLPEYEVKFAEDSVSYSPTNGRDPEIEIGRRTLKLSEYFDSSAPTIRFHDNSFLIWNEYYEIKLNEHPPFDPAKIQVWDWGGVNLKLESQREEKLSDSIQFRVIKNLKANPESFGIIFDDDAAGEVADVVAIRETDEHILIQLYHCKFSTKEQSGAMVKDLYEVCGQAQKSVTWNGRPESLLEHLQLRESSRLSNNKSSRIERGDMATLNYFEKRLRTKKAKMEIFIVQPGLSKNQVSPEQMELLGATEMYLKDTWSLDFFVIGSE